MFPAQDPSEGRLAEETRKRYQCPAGTPLKPCHAGPAPLRALPAANGECPRDGARAGPPLIALTAAGRAEPSRARRGTAGTAAARRLAPRPATSPHCAADCGPAKQKSKSRSAPSRYPRRPRQRAAAAGGQGGAQGRSHPSPPSPSPSRGRLRPRSVLGWMFAPACATLHPPPEPLIPSPARLLTYGFPVLTTGPSVLESGT